MPPQFTPRGASIAEKMQSAYATSAAMEQQAMQRQQYQTSLQQALMERQIQQRTQQLAPAALSRARSGDYSLMNEIAVFNPDAGQQLSAMINSQGREERADAYHPSKLMQYEAQARKSISDADVAETYGMKQAAAQLGATNASAASSLESARSSMANAARIRQQTEQERLLFPGVQEAQQLGNLNSQEAAAGKILDNIGKKQGINKTGRADINEALAFGEQYIANNGDPAKLGEVINSRFGPEVASDPMLAENLQALLPATVGGETVQNPFTQAVRIQEGLDPAAKQQAVPGFTAMPGYGRSEGEVGKFREFVASGNAINTLLDEYKATVEEGGLANWQGEYRRAIVQKDEALKNLARRLFEMGTLDEGSMASLGRLLPSAADESWRKVKSKDEVLAQLDEAKKLIGTLTTTRGAALGYKTEQLSDDDLIGKWTK